MSHIQSPTLILWGESDRLVSPSYADDFRTQNQDSQVEIMRECPHMPMLEKREELVSLVSEFLSNGS